MSLAGEYPVRPRLELRDPVPAALSLLVDDHLASPWCLAPEVHPLALPHPIRDEREPVRLVGELRPTVAEEDPGLEARGVAGYGGRVAQLQPDDCAHTLLPEQIEGLLEPPGMLLLRDAVGIGRLRVPPDLGGPDRMAAVRPRTVLPLRLTEDALQAADVRRRDVALVARVAGRLPDVDRVMRGEVECRR